MDENKFWLAIWAIVGACFMSIVLGVAGYQINTTNKIEVLVQQGANPLEAYCAINGSRQTDAVCVILATGSRK